MRKLRPIIFAAVFLLLSLLTIGFASEQHHVTAAQAAAPVVPPPAPPSSQTAPPPGAAPHVRPFVILDAAEGGSESGAALSSTLVEKTVNLALAHRVQKELEARGVPVVLTRVADNLLTPEQRAVAANASHASLYVALHASASGHGVRFYTALLPAADVGQARRSFLPWDSAQSSYLAQSSAALRVLSAECASGGLPVRSSSVLMRPLGALTLAAVAVELSPLGPSPNEVADAEYQQKVAAGLAAGIVRLWSEWEGPQ